MHRLNIVHTVFDKYIQFIIDVDGLLSYPIKDNPRHMSVFMGGPFIIKH